MGAGAAGVRQGGRRNWRGRSLLCCLPPLLLGPCPHLAPRAPPAPPALQVQLGDKLALVREGRVVHVLATANSSLFPRVAALRPLVAEPDAEGGVTLSVWGYHLDSEDDTLLARSNGAPPPACPAACRCRLPAAGCLGWLAPPPRRRRLPAHLPSNCFPHLPAAPFRHLPGG